MVQPFVESVQRLGELSVIVALSSADHQDATEPGAGAPSTASLSSERKGSLGRFRVCHALRKLPKSGDFRVQADFGATEVAVEATAIERRVALSVAEALAKDCSAGADVAEGVLGDGLGFDALAAGALRLPTESLGVYDVGPGPSSSSAADVLFVRVDMLSPAEDDADRRPMVIEAEAIEPSLYYDVGKKDGCSAGAKLADLLAEQVRRVSG